MTRRASTVLFAVVAILVTGAMTAFACTNLATLNLSENAGQPGAEVAVTGTAFAVSDDPVALRWGGADGPVLTQVPTDPTGTFETSAVIPAGAEPGHHVVVATQMVEGEDGEVPAYGTPAKASFFVGSAAPPAEISEESRPPVAAGTSEAGMSGGLLGLMALLALAGIGLFGTGLGLFVREARRRTADQPAPVRTT